MRVLVACEESQAVCKAFRARGHEAYSADIQECSGGHPEWHIKGDVLNILNPVNVLFSGTPNAFGGISCNPPDVRKGISFQTMDGVEHFIPGKWDLIIAHPPCTYLSNAGTRHFSLKCTPAEKVQKRWELRYEAHDFFLQFVNADCEHIAIENPVGYMNTSYRKPDQIIHPYYFAEDENDKENYFQKRTCLWLKGLPTLKRRNNLKKPEPVYYCQGEKCKGKAIGWCEAIKGTSGGQAGRAKARSKTFPGIAKAMSEQWG